MTRINLVPPQLLKNEHVLAEYKELPRIFTLATERHDRGQVPADFDIPSRYVYGKGHVTFFFDKCAWLWRRYHMLCLELDDRNYKLNLNIQASIRDDTKRLMGTPWWGDWKPTHADYYLNFARLVRRAKMASVWVEVESDL